MRTKSTTTRNGRSQFTNIRHGGRGARVGNCGSGMRRSLRPTRSSDLGLHGRNKFGFCVTPVVSFLPCHSGRRRSKDGKPGKTPRVPVSAGNSGSVEGGVAEGSGGAT